MSTISQSRLRPSVALGLVLALIAAMMTFGTSPASAANPNPGTIKVSQDSTCAEDGNGNNPKVENPFYIGGEGFSPVGLEFTLTIATQPGGSVEWTGSGTVDANGSFCVGPIDVPPGMYKVELESENGSKFKVFSVEVADPVVVVPTEPTVSPATCDAPGALTIPTSTESITYTVAPTYTEGATGDFTVTATANEGFTFAGDQTTIDYPVTVDPQLTEGCTTDPVVVVPTEPTVSPATCDAPGALTIPTSTESITYTVAPTYTEGATGDFTVTATANEGFTFAGDQTTIDYPVTVDPQLTEGCTTDPVVVVPTEPTVSPATCDAPGALTIPTSTESITYTVAPTYTEGATGDFTVTATANEGFTFAGDQTTINYPVTVNPQLTEGCTTDPVVVVPTEPTVSPATCDAPGALTIPTSTESITYTVAPTYTEGATGDFTVTATANEGFTFAGDQTTINYPVTVNPQLTEGCDAVGGSEQELAETGANVGPAGLGLLLIVSGAALLGGRRFAVR